MIPGEGSMAALAASLGATTAFPPDAKQSSLSMQRWAPNKATTAAWRRSREYTRCKLNYINIPDQCWNTSGDIRSTEMTGMSERKYRTKLEVAAIYIIVSNLVFTMEKRNAYMW